VPTDDDSTAHDIPNDHDVTPAKHVNHHHGARFHHHLDDPHLDDQLLDDELHDVDLDVEHVDDHDVELDDDNDRDAGAAASRVADSYSRWGDRREPDRRR
jgi:hypothetical protein